MLAHHRHRAFTGRTATTGAAPVRVPSFPTLSSRRYVHADAGLKDAPITPVMEKGEVSQFPEQPAVYAVYDKDNVLQYIGLTRKVRNATCLQNPPHKQHNSRCTHV
jgi:hypothetical protein